MPICPFIGLSVYWRRPVPICPFIGLSVYRRRPVPICPFIGLSAQAGADLSVYRFIGLSAQAGKNRPCHHAEQYYYYLIYILVTPHRKKDEEHPYQGLLPEINIFSLPLKKWGVGILISFWDGLFFQGQTVSLPEGKWSWDVRRETFMKISSSTGWLRTTWQWWIGMTRCLRLRHIGWFLHEVSTYAIKHSGKLR